MLTERARTRIFSADVIMGNERYIELIKEIIPTSAELIIGKMGTEVERAKKAVELGSRKNVVIVSGGDPGIYGMAGLVLEVSGDSDIGVEIVPGITAASAAAALLGAPLSNDFAVVSLSDLLVPWPEIEKRLEGLAMMGIAVVIYNPKSKTRYKENEKCFVNNPKTMEIAVKEDMLSTGIPCIVISNFVCYAIEKSKAKKKVIFAMPAKICDLLEINAHE